MPRSFRLFWCGEVVSLLGAATTATLLPLLAVLDLGAGPGWLGAITAAAWLPWLIFGLPAGALVDGWQPRTVMVAADLVGCTAALSVPIAAALDLLTLAQLLVVALTIGASTVFFRASLPRLLVRVVAPEDRVVASSRMFAAESGSAIVGPGLAGLIARIMSPALGMIVDAVSFLVSAVCVAKVRETARDSGEPAVTEPIRRRIIEGLGVIARDPILRYTAVIAPIQNIAFVGLLTLQVLFMVDTLRLSASGVGLLLAAAGAGGVAGALLGPPVARRFGNARAVVGLQLISIGCLVIPLATPGAGVAVMVVGLFLAEAPIVADNVIRSGWRLSYLPQHLQARVGASVQVLAYGSMPLAALFAGWLGGQIGVRGSLTALLCIHAAAALTFPFGPIGGRRNLPTDFAEVHRVSLSG